MEQYSNVTKDQLIAFIKGLGIKIDSRPGKLGPPKPVANIRCWRISSEEESFHLIESRKNMALYFLDTKSALYMNEEDALDDWDFLLKNIRTNHTVSYKSPGMIIARKISGNSRIGDQLAILETRPWVTIDDKKTLFFIMNLCEKYKIDINSIEFEGIQAAGSLF